MKDTESGRRNIEASISEKEEIVPRRKSIHDEML
jgi:hypothetical protein